MTTDLKKELSRDGLHPNDEGYRIMTVLLRGVLDRSAM
jgi:lysophospholipase L1-like esterase